MANTSKILANFTWQCPKWNDQEVEFLAIGFSSCLLAQPVRFLKQSKMVTSTTVNNGSNAMNTGNSLSSIRRKK